MLQGAFLYYSLFTIHYSLFSNRKIGIRKKLKITEPLSECTVGKISATGSKTTSRLQTIYFSFFTIQKAQSSICITFVAFEG